MPKPMLNMNSDMKPSPAPGLPPTTMYYTVMCYLPCPYLVELPGLPTLSRATWANYPVFRLSLGHSWAGASLLVLELPRATYPVLGYLSFSPKPLRLPTPGRPTLELPTFGLPTLALPTPGLPTLGQPTLKLSTYPGATYPWASYPGFPNGSLCFLNSPRSPQQTPDATYPWATYPGAS
jgi:hypothetical protein